MTKTFPIRIESHQERIPIKQGKQKKEKTYHPIRSAIKWEVGKVIAIIILIYACIAIYHGMQYVPDEYVCHHMARDLEDTLEAYGFEVKIITGWKNLTNGTEITNGSKGHAWININGIDLDSVWLVPVPMRTQYPYKGKEYDDYTDYAKTIYGNDEYLEKALAGEL